MLPQLLLSHREISIYDNKMDVASGRYMEYALLQWLYAYRLQELKHVTVNGYLKDVSYHSRLVNKISRIYYK